MIGNRRQDRESRTASRLPHSRDSATAVRPMHAATWRERAAVVVIPGDQLRSSRAGNISCEVAVSACPETARMMRSARYPGAFGAGPFRASRKTRISARAMRACSLSSSNNSASLRSASGQIDRFSPYFWSVSRKAASGITGPLNFFHCPIGLRQARPTLPW